MQVEDRAVAVNEIAFFSGGELLPVAVSEGDALALVDEQNTVPKAPSYFNGMIFDEIYHARTAYENIHNLSVYEWTHPPLGKLIIALGILLFGMKPFGWRIMGAYYIYFPYHKIALHYFQIYGFHLHYVLIILLQNHLL